VKNFGQHNHGELGAAYDAHATCSRLHGGRHQEFGAPGDGAAFAYRFASFAIVITEAKWSDSTNTRPYPRYTLRK